MSNSSKVLVKAEFSSVLVTYLFLIVIGWLLVSLVGIILIPFWLVIGRFLCKRYLKYLKCNLTGQTLEIKKGYLFRIEKTIPLDKIQDMTLREGPLLRSLGICILDIETAGQSKPEGFSDAKIIGVKDAKIFRDRVLTQRDLLFTKKMESASGSNISNDEILTSDILIDIRDSLHKIEKLLDK